MDDRQRKEMFVQKGEICFSRVYAKSGAGYDVDQQEDCSSTDDDEIHEN